MSRCLLPLAVAMLALSGCGAPPQIHASNAYVRLPAVAGRPAAAYFTLYGGPADATLLMVSTPVAIRVEMHESTASGTMSSMKPLGPVALPALGEVHFAPGGRHVMLFDLNPGITPGKGVPLSFTFTNGERVGYTASVIAAGDPVPTL